jgi:hypothetical protein
VSQYIIAEVIEKGSQDLTELVFRILLFNTFTSINTYETLRRSAITPFTWSSYERADYERVLRRSYDDKVSIYTGAFLKPAPNLGFVENFMNHLVLMEVLMKTCPCSAQRPSTLQASLNGCASMGDFTAYQLSEDVFGKGDVNFLGSRKCDMICQ